MDRQRTLYKLVGKQCRNKTTEFYILKSEDNKEIKVNEVQMAFYVGRKQVTNVKAQIYKDMLLFRGVDCDIKNLPTIQLDDSTNTKSVSPVEPTAPTEPVSNTTSTSNKADKNDATDIKVYTSKASDTTLKAAEKLISRIKGSIDIENISISDYKEGNTCRIDFDLANNDEVFPFIYLTLSVVYVQPALNITSVAPSKPIKKTIFNMQLCIDDNEIETESIKDIIKELSVYTNK